MEQKSYPGLAGDLTGHHFQLLHRFLCPWLFETQEQKSKPTASPAPMEPPFPPTDSWSTLIEALSSRRLPETLGTLQKKRGKSHLEIIVALGQNVKEVQSGVCLPWERVWLKYMSLQPIFRQTDFSLCWLQSAVCLDACKFGGILYLKAKFGFKDQFSTVKSERRYFSRGFSYFCDRTSLYLLIKCSPHHGY